ncbi:MAG: folate/biopterin family MFS transporter [Gammaproteobacteria bacterium]|nr:folate/biopterin family MFS transporter [Gammaproteobacteria bacterium]
MVYLAAGISGLTAIVGTFFVKDYLGLSAAFLAGLGFWAGIPWVLKMPLGHLVDLFWRWKSLLVFLGAGLIAVSLGIMFGLLAYTDFMRQWLKVELWYVVSVLLAPVGYVIQDVVADAMTVEAVPRVDQDGKPIEPETLRLMHTTMQTLGRIAIVGGGVTVAIVNIVMFQDIESLSESVKVSIYTKIYLMALGIPIISIFGVILAGFIKSRDALRLSRKGFSKGQIKNMLYRPAQPPAANWWILSGSLVFVLFTLTMGLTEIAYNQEIIFIGSLSIVLFLIARLTRVMDAYARRVLVGTALLIFIYRALPGPGAGSTWWMIDELGFDQQFLSVLSLIGSSLTLLGMFVFRRFMAEKSMAYIIGVLTIAGTLLALPMIGMYHGVHEWTAAHTHGIVDARFIALIDTALESPLGQIAMIPMLAWIANSAPSELKATFFAVMASFTNLALSLGQLVTKYINQIFTITREVKDPLTGTVTTPADYGELGSLLVTVTVAGFVLPMLAILLVRKTRIQALSAAP